MENSKIKLEKNNLYEFKDGFKCIKLLYSEYETIKKDPNVVYFIEPDEIELNNYSLEDIKQMKYIEIK